VGLTPVTKSTITNATATTLTGVLVGNGSTVSARPDVSPSPAGTFAFATVTVDSFGRVTNATAGVPMSIGGTISGATAGRVLLVGAGGVLSEVTTTGTGDVVRATGPTLSGATLSGVTRVGSTATGISENAAGVVEVNNGTAGDFRDLRLRNLTASGNLGIDRGPVPASATLSVPSGTIVALDGVSQSVQGRLYFSASGGTNIPRAGVGFGTIGGTAVTIGHLAPSAGGALWLNFSTNGAATGLHVTHNHGSALLSITSAGALSCVGRGTYAGLTVSGANTLALGTYTVGTLPSAAANAGAIAQVTDSSVTTNGSPVADGGTNRVMVFSNGTTWDVVVA
jgi:hypothetical protein